MSLFLTSAQVEQVHALMSGQPARDRAGLAGAVDRARAQWDGTLLYPRWDQQAAVILISISSAQAFIDGNKRAAWVACDVFLHLNGYRFDVIGDDEIVRLMHDISTHSADEADVAAWIATRAVPREGVQ